MAAVITSRGVHRSGPAALAAAAALRAAVSTTVVAVAAATGLGFGVRLGLVLAGQWPLNDGGMFFAMARDLSANGWRIPAETSYNGLHLPFAYSPFSFYLADAVSAVGHVSLIHVFMYLPPVASAATVLAAYLLFRAMLPSRASAKLATFVFALLPAGFLWLITGGGVARAVGLLFGVLAVHQAHRLFVQHKGRALVPLAALVSLALASHLETGAWAATTCVVFMAVYRRDRAGALWLAAAGALSLALTAPWWATVVAQHGLSPFLNASTTGGLNPLGPIELAGLQITAEPGFPLLGGLALLGAIVCIRTGRYFLPAWPAVILAFDTRAGATYAMIPIAMLAAIGFVECLLPLLSSRSPGALGPVVSDGRNLRRATVAALCVGVYALAALATLPFASREPTRALASSTRSAMAWVKSETPAGTTFLVVSGQPDWQLDAAAEWFPVLAGRRSLATVQGTEWDGAARFTRATDEAKALQACAGRDGACLFAWMQAAHTWPQYVYVGNELYADLSGRASPCCGGLLQSLAHDPGYREVFQNAGAAVFERVAATSPR